MATFNPIPVATLVRSPLPTDMHAPAANTDAVVTYPAAGEGIAHAITGVAFSYGNTGTIDADANLAIADGDNVLLSLDISAKGHDVIPFNMVGSPNSALTITLEAGGADVSGKLVVLGHSLVSGSTVLFGMDFGSPDSSWLLGVI